mmetsp:Transcript_46765/g.109080  ORF Transcript_46765/g.109080 Transcript_46765/m.109080 type:complete len:150 (+) Transcript_46765:818-1267(+)
MKGGLTLHLHPLALVAGQTRPVRLRRTAFSQARALSTWLLWGAAAPGKENGRFQKSRYNAQVAAIRGAPARHVSRPLATFEQRSLLHQLAVQMVAQAWTSMLDTSHIACHQHFGLPAYEALFTTTVRSSDTSTNAAEGFNMLLLSAEFA